MCRLPLLNITGGLYTDIDSVIFGKIKDLKLKSCYGLSLFTKSNDDSTSISDIGKVLVKANVENNNFCKLITEHLYIVGELLYNLHNVCYSTDPANYIKYIANNNLPYRGNEVEVIKKLTDEGLLLDLASSIFINMEQGKGYNADYNNPEDLKKLSLDKQDYSKKSSELENLSLEQPGNSQEKGR